MYNPARFQEQDPKLWRDLVNHYPLATVISIVEGLPQVSHLPLVLGEEDGQTVLYGHLAAANPHAKNLDRASVYVIFHGPQAYVTPKWYVENDVPTWGYAVVHMQGRAALLSDRENLTESLRKLSQHMEVGPEAWAFWIPPDLEKNLSQAIVGLRIVVESVNAKFKLNQGRTAEDFQGVIKGLSEREDGRALAELMKQKYPR